MQRAGRPARRGSKAGARARASARLGLAVLRRIFSSAGFQSPLVSVSFHGPARVWGSIVGWEVCRLGAAAVHIRPETLQKRPPSARVAGRANGRRRAGPLQCGAGSDPHAGAPPPPGRWATRMSGRASALRHRADRNLEGKYQGASRIPGGCRSRPQQRRPSRSPGGVAPRRVSSCALAAIITRTAPAPAPASPPEACTCACGPPASPHGSTGWNSRTAPCSPRTF